MKVVETSESERINRQLETLDVRAVNELVAELREVHMFGYEYVGIAKLERGLLAAAGLQGLTAAFSVEEAVQLLANRGTEDEDRIKGLETSNDELSVNFDQVHEELRAAKARIDELEKRPAGEQVEVIFINEAQADSTATLLAEANEVLVTVPGQRSLAQRAIHAARLFTDMTISTVVVVEEEDEL